MLHVLVTCRMSQHFATLAGLSVIIPCSPARGVLPVACFHGCRIHSVTLTMKPLVHPIAGIPGFFQSHENVTDSHPEGGVLNLNFPFHRHAAMLQGA